MRTRAPLLAPVFRSDGQGIDVIVVGEPDAAAVYDACERVEHLIGRPVNPTITTRHELSRETGFLDHVRVSPIVQLPGEPPWHLSKLVEGAG